jgi:hypothetical protein
MTKKPLSEQQQRFLEVLFIPESEGGDSSKLLKSFLEELLEYDSKTGKLFWKHRDEKWFMPGEKASSPANVAYRWNCKKAGKEAFIYINKKGYLKGKIFGKTLLAHRVIYFIHHGYWPDQVDHIDGNPSNNLIDNLRSVNQVENGRNQKLSSANTSGVPGVSFQKQKNKWRVCIKVLGKVIFLGYYVDKNKAIAARKQAEVIYGFHKNHGRVSA